MSEQPASPYILGLDLGAESIGWAMIATAQGEPASIRGAGVHCFDAGVEGDFESGRDKSRAKVRRDARQPRRQNWRRMWRRRKVLGILQRAGLLPPGAVDNAEAIHAYFLTIDAGLRTRHARADRPADLHVLLYRLRSEALDRKLEPAEVGRILYHLAQRRGFLSNRKQLAREDEEGQVKAGIAELEQRMQKAGARTLGEFFSRLDPREERIRRRWTSRAMYLAEFEAIWSAQATQHPECTPELKAKLRRAMFYQRPLKSQRHLVGRCELIPGRRCVAIASRIYQRFRLLQKVNDLLVLPPDAASRPLTPEERNKLIAALATDGDLKFTTIRGKKLLNLPKGTTFNLETDGETKIPGHRTDAALAKVFGPRWWQLTDEERDRIVDEILSFEKPEALARRAVKAWGLDETAAKTLASTSLEPSFARHCRRALQRLVPRMEEGLPYATARRDEFPERFATRPPAEVLAPVSKAVPDLRNPAVARALTELRKVVNAVIRRYGKPERVRIELARDLKRPRKHRKELSKRMRANEGRREAAKARILQEAGIARPSAADIEKVLLAEECGWICPYSGRSIGMQALVGASPQFDVEHILPMSRSLDNTFVNKTLCYHEENRDRKVNRTPFEAYAHSNGRWEEILGRVKRFQGDLAREKLRRFLLEEIPADFTERQLQDTRYISRLAGDYLATLYGGRSDAEGTQRIQVSAGGITAHLRNEWMLNAVLGDGGRKSRSDHRHHAVDAVAIGLASPAVVKLLMDAAAHAQQNGRRLFAPVPTPWPTFLADVQRAVDEIRVSRRVSRKLNGPLHAETFYSKPIPGRKSADVRHVRKELSKLTPAEIAGESIVDPVIRRIVQEKHRELGGGPPAKVFAEPKTHPRVATRTGNTIPIHKVRVRARVKDPRALGRGLHVRYVGPARGVHHHMDIVAVLGADGTTLRWQDHPVSRIDLLQRVSRGLTLAPAYGPHSQILFTLALHEHVAMKDDAGRERVYRVIGLSPGDMEFQLDTDARTRDDSREAGLSVRGGANELRKREARKVRITHLGEVLPCHD